MACALLVSWLTSCATAPRVYETAVQTGPPRYSLVFLVHGDANYVYHDTVGIAHFANEDALAKAHVVARSNPDAEVFIFHDKPLSHSLLFFKQRDGDFYYYRNGELAATHSYWRDEGTSRFATQGALYDTFRSKFNSPSQQRPTRMFLYFGHEVPEVEGLHYDASYEDSTLSIAKFSSDLRAFTTDDTRFDLFVMSTCFNGTPHSVAALAPYARYVLASPTNLHLSYFDIAPFEHLESSMSTRDVASFTRYAAQHAFDKLSSYVQTVVSVGVYDVPQTLPYLQSIGAAYEQALTSIHDAPTLSLAHCDCAELAPFNSPLMKAGVDVLYRPAKFGRDANKLQHSGWSCWMHK